MSGGSWLIPYGPTADCRLVESGSVGGNCLHSAREELDLSHRCTHSSPLSVNLTQSIYRQNLVFLRATIPM